MTIVTVSDSLMSLALALAMMGWKRFSPARMRLETLVGMRDIESPFVVDDLPFRSSFAPSSSSLG
jgi:hypothetical protein